MLSESTPEGQFLSVEFRYLGPGLATILWAKTQNFFACLIAVVSRRIGPVLGIPFEGLPVP